MAVIENISEKVKILLENYKFNADTLAKYLGLSIGQISDMPYLFVKSWLPKTKINRTGTRSADNSANHVFLFF